MKKQSYTTEEIRGTLLNELAVVENMISFNIKQWSDTKNEYYEHSAKMWMLQRITIESLAHKFGIDLEV